MTAALRVGGWSPDHAGFSRPSGLRAVLPGLRLALSLLPQPAADSRLWQRRKPWSEILAFLEQRVGLLEAVVFSGEPTLQTALPTPSPRCGRWATRSACTAPASSRSCSPTSCRWWIGSVSTSRRYPSTAPRSPAWMAAARPTGRASSICLKVASSTNAGPPCTGSCSMPIACGTWPSACAVWVSNASPVQCVRTARMLDDNLAESRAPYDQQLWERLDRLFPSFVLRG